MDDVPEMPADVVSTAAEILLGALVRPAAPFVGAMPGAAPSRGAAH